MTRECNKMNLAIEYMLRSKELRNNVEFPFSIFIKNSNTNEKRVVTVREIPNKKNLIVKHWFIEKCNFEEFVPPVEDYEISHEELYTSKHIIVPEFDLHPYQVEPFYTGMKQHADEPLASMEKEIYDSHFNFFLNSKKHQISRIDWLWGAFCKTYKFDYVSSIFTSKKYLSKISQCVASYVNTLKYKAPQLLKKWGMWQKYMLGSSTNMVASELLFYSEYQSLIKSENRKPKTLSFSYILNGRIGNSLSTATCDVQPLGIKWNNYYYIN